jgi:hypothetical protein
MRNGTSRSWQIRRLKSPPSPGEINAAPMPSAANPHVHPRKGNFQFIHIIEFQAPNDLEITGRVSFVLLELKKYSDIS